MIALLLAAGLAQAAPVDTLTTLLRESRLTMVPTAEGGIAGPGAELLIDAARASRFTLIGEEHGIADVPELATALFEALVPAGYRHVAIETSPPLAAEMQRRFRSGGEGAFEAFLREHRPAVAFFFWEQDAAFARAAVEALPDVPDVLWGLDYDITADRYAFRRLRELATDAAGRAAVDRAIALGDSALAVGFETKNPGAMMMWGGPDHVYAELRAALRPEPGSEADRILWLLEETRAINGLYLSGANYESNLRRARLNKRQFMDYYGDAVGRGEKPRVLYKFGASHMFRGRGLTNVFDLGTQAAELAEMGSDSSFHILVVGGPGTRQARLDPTVFRSVEAPATMLQAPWLKPFHDATDPAAWTVFDLRPLRAPNQRQGLGALPELTSRLIYAFDAVVVLGGSGPQRDLVR